MLEFCNTNTTTTIEDLKDFFTVSFTIIDDIYQGMVPNEIKNRRNINISIMSDSKIIAIAIVGELMTIDSEKSWLGFC
ncbi:MAG TPA: IS982 family transposase, partial [Clostridium sp.]|nr:IS982 family transposase [Clostridium sp.]